MAPVGNTEIWLLIIANATLLGRDIIKLLKAAVSKNGNGTGAKVDVRVGASGNQAQNGGGGNGKSNGLCRQHSENIVELRTKLENYESNFETMRRENRDDHQKLFDELRSRSV